MNKKELKEFVAADREIIEKEMSEKIKRIFLNILGVEPDKVFPKMTYEKRKRAFNNWNNESNGGKS
jgi:aspartyl-tRNA synthetase